MTPDPYLLDLRRDLAQRSKWNIGFFIAGVLLWAFIYWAGQEWPLETARIWFIVATFFVFPVAVIASKLLGADPFTRENILGQLVGYTHMSTIALSFPIVVVVALYFPESLILFMAILYCIDFYVMSWAFGIFLFGLHALVRTIAVTFVWFAMPEQRLTLIPLIVAGIYLLTVLLIPLLRRRWLSQNADGALTQS